GAAADEHVLVAPLAGARRRVAVDAALQRLDDDVALDEARVLELHERGPELGLERGDVHAIEGVEEGVAALGQRGRVEIGRARGGAATTGDATAAAATGAGAGAGRGAPPHAARIAPRITSLRMAATVLDQPRADTA